MVNDTGVHDSIKTELQFLYFAMRMIRNAGNTKNALRNNRASQILA
jgi:hypothetical protein